MNKQKIKKFKNPDIFQFSISPLVELQKFKIKLREKGLDLHQSGKETNISYDLYQRLLRQGLLDDPNQVPVVQDQNTSQSNTQINTTQQ